MKERHRERAFHPLPDEFKDMGDRVLDTFWTPLTIAAAIELTGRKGRWYRFQMRNDSLAQVNAARVRDRWGLEATAHLDGIFVQAA